MVKVKMNVNRLRPFSFWRLSGYAAHITMATLMKVPSTV